MKGQGWRKVGKDLGQNFSWIGDRKPGEMLGSFTARHSLDFRRHIFREFEQTNTHITSFTLPLPTTSFYEISLLFKQHSLCKERQLKKEPCVLVSKLFIEEDSLVRSHQNLLGSKDIMGQQNSCCKTQECCARIMWEGIDPEHVVLPSIGAPEGSKYTWLFFVRVLFLLWTISVIIAEWAIDPSFEVYFCYLTIWGWWYVIKNYSKEIKPDYRSLMLYFIFVTIANIRYKPGIEKELDCIDKTAVSLFSLSIVLSVVITILYWSLLFEPPEANSQYPRSSRFFNVSTHALNVFMAIFNAIFSRTTPKVAHAIIVLVISVLYIPTNAACSISNQENVYPILDWLEPNAETAIVSVMGVVGGVIVFYILYGLLLARDKSCTKIQPKPKTETLQDHDAEPIEAGDESKALAKA